MPFTIVQQDITKMKVDAVVNAANTNLAMGGGVCGAIFTAAGISDMQNAYAVLAPIKTGDAVITPGFRLPAKYVIHTAGPIYQGGKSGEAGQLRSCYLNSLKLAVENKCNSIAFPLISSGIYGYPKQEALSVATSAIRDFLAAHDLDVYLALLDKSVFVVSEKLLGDVEDYIDEHYIERYRASRRELQDTIYKIVKEAGNIDYKASAPIESTVGAGLDELVDNLDEPFSKTLLRLIDARGKTDVEVYKRANIDRKLFSKIRTGINYTPSKRTVIALAIALELSLDETEDLLKRAGYALSHSRKFDVIIEYFIINGKYDIYEINEVLFKYDQPLLGG